jgi:hypothetical protein
MPATVLLGVLAGALGIHPVYCPHHAQAREYPANITQLLRLPARRLSDVPVTRMNLLCAAGLSAHSNPDLSEFEETLSFWAEHVRSETSRHLYRFARNPAEFENSPGFFRMLLLTVVLSEDFGVHYDPTRTAGPALSYQKDGFFSDPQSVFLDGLLGPKRLGTCSSLPVLYVAIGRHLGYPLKLVTTKAHLFVRWDGGGERFNVEATARGLCRFEDDYYRHWPFEIGSKEESENHYLKSLTPPEELAVFLSIRGMCMLERGRSSEAADAFGAAARLAPDCREYSDVLALVKVGLQKPLKASSIGPGSLSQTAPR